jgi:hypothetical protein
MQVAITVYIAIKKEKAMLFFHLRKQTRRAKPMTQVQISNMDHLSLILLSFGMNTQKQLQCNMIFVDSYRWADLYLNFVPFL